VDPDRLPEEVVHLSNPLEWEEDIVTALCFHIDAGQREVLAQPRIFQFARLNDGSYHDGYMEIMSPKANLRYTGTSRLYVARLLHNDPDDSYALREITHQLLSQNRMGPGAPASAYVLSRHSASLGRNGVSRERGYMPPALPIFILRSLALVRVGLVRPVCPREPARKKT
jgi:hypothetical protein